jgi:DNA-binding MarR family transcriptional regulator
MAKIEVSAVAERLHAAAIRLLRRARAADVETALSPPRLSALSVLAFVGPQSLTQLARAEQVTAPTMSKLVADLAVAGLVTKRTDRADKRGVNIQVTAKGRALMEEGRRRRLLLLRGRLAGFTAAELRTLSEAAELMLRASRED